jgi:hypothetical protein
VARFLAGKLLFRCLAVPLAKLLDTSFRVYVCGLPRKERMTFRAGINVHFLDRRAGLNNVAARANNARFVILGMNACLHENRNLSFSFEAARRV